MILQALTQHYEDLLAAGEITAPGWGSAKVAYALDLAADGTLRALLPLYTPQQRGDSTVLVPRTLEVPQPVKRSSGVAANFLCDNSGYLLGVDSKGKPQRTAQCFAASRALHRRLLADAPSPAARAVAAFFARWDPAAAADHPALADGWADLLKGANLVFWYEDAPVSSDPVVRARWQAAYDQQGRDDPPVRCLVTGERAAPARIHPAVKGVRDAQSSGAALVSFNAPAFCSYDHEYAPIGAYAAFAYTTALNHLLADRERVQHLGDTTVVFWAAGGERAYADLGMAALYGDTLTTQDIGAALAKLARGEPVDWEDTRLDPDRPFYVLGLAPNAARLAVRFFWQNRFGDLMRNIQAHYERLSIVRPAYDTDERLFLGRLLKETVRDRRKDTPSPPMAGDVLRAVLTDGPYPASLLYGVVLRLRADREVTRGRAAILKAYYLRNTHPDCPKEVLQMELNEASHYLPYVLGRLFSVLEEIQQKANPGINTTIKDKFFTAASTTPSMAFPTLINLAQKHLRKLESGYKIHYGRLLGGLMEKITVPYPARLSLPEQGAFQLGYYHQTQQRYTKKEEQ